MSVRAKICGLSSAAGGAAAIEGGAAYLGFVFYPPSPRAVSPERAAQLCAAVPSGVQRVALFVDADDAAIAAVLDLVPIDILQFHGQESPDRVAGAKARFDRPVMKAIAVAGPEDVLAASRYEDQADMLLFDAAPPRRADALPGGNGLAFARGTRPRLRGAAVAGSPLAPSVDAVGRPHLRAAARGGADLRRGGRR